MRVVCILIAVACFLCGHVLGEIITVDDDGPADFSSIYGAIDYSSDGDTIIVQPGEYSGSIDFNGKEVLITSIDPDDMNVVKSTFINGSVTFQFGESNNSIIQGFQIEDGVVIRYASPVVRKNIIVTSGNGIHIVEGGCKIYNNIIRGSQYGINVSNPHFNFEVSIINNTIFRSSRGIHIPLQVLIKLQYFYSYPRPRVW